MQPVSSGRDLRSKPERTLKQKLTVSRKECANLKIMMRHHSCFCTHLVHKNVDIGTILATNFNSIVISEKLNA